MKLGITKLLTTCGRRELVKIGTCKVLSHRLSGSFNKSPGSRYVKPATGITKYAFDKYFNFMLKYKKKIEISFPRAYRVYEVFSHGIANFYKDFKLYLIISSELRTGRAVRDLSLSELQTYYQMPKDVFKVAPVLLISILPFANYVVFPIAYAFPYHFLSHHFWSIEDTLNFSLKQHQKKLLYYKPVFRILQAQSILLSDNKLQPKLLNVVYKLGSGTHPDVEEILELKNLFTEKPFRLASLSSNHLNYLCKLHNISSAFGKKKRLFNHAGFIREMDLAIDREGLMSIETANIRMSCFLRGLNPVGLSREELISWLKEWIFITKELDRHSLSLLLHCPILLSYNHPTNWSISQ